MAELPEANVVVDTQAYTEYAGTCAIEFWLEIDIEDQNNLMKLRYIKFFW